MATERTMNAGDTYPPFKMKVSDEAGLVDLTTATAIEVRLKGAATVISGVGTAIDPPEADDANPAEGPYNLQLVFAAGDTATPDTYKAQARVTWAGGGVETFPNDPAAAPTLQIKQGEF